VKKTGVLLVGFGGPEQPSDVRPFLQEVLAGRSVPQERVDEVALQYEKIGGRSPYTDLSRALAGALENLLKIPVRVGMRCGTPKPTDALLDFKRNGVERVIAVALSAFRSVPSFNYYVKATAQAVHAVGYRGSVRFVAPWHGDPRFAVAVAGRVRDVWGKLSGDQQAKAFGVFTAHSVPTVLDRGYSSQILSLGKTVAGLVGLHSWTLAWQSRSGRPEDSWLGPDVGEVVGGVKGNGRDLILVPLGFLMDHVEVLFDLDVKARGVAEAAGWRVHRVATVGTETGFVEMLAGKVRERMNLKT